jgi:thymidylate synthase (FAD)
MSVKLIWITPNAEDLIAHMARVSNPKNQNSEDIEELIRYMMRHKHWSPFEMANAVFEINTTRDIARQILRHRSFSFQEFSQRYASIKELPATIHRECRLQGITNRQSSIETSNSDMVSLWSDIQKTVHDITQEAYFAALDAGIAKEQARALLPEGLTPTRMYMNGTIRSWLHYLDLRCKEDTQKEHRLIAEQIASILSQELPTIYAANS